jgi:aminomethyltransferase
MASLDRFVSREKDFLGKDKMFSKEPQRKLFGLELQEKGVPREGYRIEINGIEIGVVSSGTFSPTLKKGIALCFVDREYLREGAEVKLVIREKPVRAVLRRYPFIR